MQQRTSIQNASRNEQQQQQQHTRAMATVSLTSEEEGWVKAAAAADDSKGIPLADVDLDDMKEVYDALKVTGLAKSRLRSLIRKLQQQQQQQRNVADAKDTLASMLPALAETTAEKVFEKMEIASSSISFSTVKTKQYEKVTNLLRFKIKGAAWKHEGRIPETNTQVHTWLDGNEDSPENIKGYMKYINVELKPKFRWKDEHEYVDCNNKGEGLKSLLDTHHFDGQHSTSGNIDVVLVESADKAAMAIKNNIELGLELKHTNNKGEHERQVILQHLAASFLNHEYPVLTLMTDLSTRFTFYWFGKNEKIIWKYKASIAEAMYLLDHMFVKNDAGRGDDDEEETFPIDFLFDERGTWDSFNTGNNYKLGQEDLSDVLGFDTLEEHEKGEAVLEYLACNVLPNAVLT